MLADNQISDCGTLDHQKLGERQRMESSELNKRFQRSHVFIRDISH